MATLDEFLSTGRLGEIAVGYSPADVRAILGAPDDVSTRKNPQIWKYGPLEITFWSETPESEASLVTMGLYFHSSEEFPRPLGLDGWLPTGETTLASFCEHLESVGLTVTERQNSDSEDYLVLESGVRVTFDEGLLYCIHVHARRETEVRQLSVSVSPQQLEVIRKLARSRGVSMSSLCSDWIREHTDQVVAST